LVFAFAARATEPAPPPPDDVPAPAPTPAPARAPAPASPFPSASGEWNLRVHLLTKDERVELRRVVDHALICRAPCDEELTFRESDQFVLGGPGLTNSDQFQFRPRNGDVTLRVNPSGSSQRVGGGVLLGVGGFAAVIGLVASIPAGVGAGLCDQGDCSSVRNTASALQVITVVGLGLALVGVVLLATSPSTTYSVVE
jgi:hypothetical protein